MQNKNDLYSDPRIFGNFFHLLRLKYNLSRSHLAKQFGFSSETSVMNLETGKTQVRDKYKAIFCSLTPDFLDVPVMMAMFEAGSLKKPCLCPCHHDPGNELPRIYDNDGRCRLCGHTDGDCKIINGLWFESDGQNFADLSSIEQEADTLPKVTLVA